MVLKRTRPARWLTLVLTALFFVCPAFETPTADSAEGVLSGKDRPLTEVLAELNLTLSWDPLLKQAVLSRGRSFMTISPDVDFLIFNGLVKAPFPVTAVNYKTGTISAEGRQRLLEFFPVVDGSEERRISTVIIDPGHGGKDPGTVGHFTLNGKDQVLYEKDVALAVALDLRDSLRKKYPDKKIVLSRDKDVFVSLDERAQLANTYLKDKPGSTVLVSIHVNSSPNSSAKGFEVWYLPPEYRRKLLADEEIKIADKSLFNIINSAREEQYTVDSILLGQGILKSMSDSIGASSSRGLKEETWYVVRSALMPAVLVELAFVTNPAELQLLRTDAYLKKLGEGIYNGICSFVETYEDSISRSR